MRKLLFGIILCFNLTGIDALAQGPNNTGTYYKYAHGRKGADLKTAMYRIIKEPSVLTYNDLWEAYKQTDVRDDGYIWDMYTNSTFYPLDCPHKNSAEGSGINREHSMPKSWFNSMKPAYTDVMHVIPTDGYINNMRSDMPYGEVASITKASANNFSKVGMCAVEGYSKKVFEPNDEYKGDLARIYFYMATCYEPYIAEWVSDMLGGDSYQPFADWAMPMLLRWAKNDPVSPKELARNEAVFRMQGNRNPFVDFPGLEQHIWGEQQEEELSYDGTDATTPIEPTSASSCNIQLNKAFFGVDWSDNRNTRNYWERTPLHNEQNGVTVVYNYGIEGQNMYANPTQIRLYKYNVLTFKTERDPMTSITLKVETNTGDKVLTASVGEMDGYSWKGNATEVTFTVNEGNGNLQVSAANVVVDSATGIDFVTPPSVASDHIYNMQGVCVDGQDLRPGIYIKNGKKIIIR